MMSYENKLENAASLIEAYNAALDEKDNKIDVKQFNQKLKKIGGIDEQSIMSATFEDLEDCGLPRILARNVAKVFRSEPTIDPKYVPADKAAGMAPLYLLQSYNPKDPTSPVAKRLKELSRDQRFIVFKSGSTVEVNADVSHKLLKEVMQGFPAREEYEIEPGRFVRTYAVGDSLGEYVDENPLYPGRPLREDGFCDQTNRSWSGVPLSVRQLVYLAVKQGAISVSIDKAHDILDIAVTADAEQALRRRYSKTAVALDELIEAGNAPKLKIKLGGTTSRSNDPFFGHKKF